MVRASGIMCAVGTVTWVGVGEGGPGFDCRLVEHFFIFFIFYCHRISDVSVVTQDT